LFINEAFQRFAIEMGGGYVSFCSVVLLDVYFTRMTWDETLLASNPREHINCLINRSVSALTHMI